ncbi:MAG TPA: hypothetical protein VGT02_17045 [Methylomirabilota bacterium]|jgi:hypothetical protein|nr:hypothetical protein [Methylomirabilota bacterium]
MARVAVTVVVVLALLGGCGPFRPIDTQSPPVQDTSLVTFLDMPLAMWLRIAGHQSQRLDSGLLLARLRIENFLDTDRWVDIQIVFRDKDGFEVEKSNWEPIMLHRRRVTEYQINSLSPRPVDYRILVRDPKG